MNASLFLLQLVLVSHQALDYHFGRYFAWKYLFHFPIQLYSITIPLPPHLLPVPRQPLDDPAGRHPPRHHVWFDVVDGRFLRRRRRSARRRLDAAGGQFRRLLQPRPQPRQLHRRDRHRIAGMQSSFCRVERRCGGIRGFVWIDRRS